MNRILRVLIFFTAFALYLLLLESCKKDKSIDKTGTNNSNTNTTDPPPVDNGNNTATCKAVNADAGNIEIFPADNPWNEDISSSPVDPYNSQIISSFSTNIIKADFGSGLWDNAPLGIPYVVVCGSQQKLPVTFTDYGD